MKPQQMILNSRLCYTKRRTAMVLLILGMGLNLFVLAGCQHVEKAKTMLPDLRDYVDMAIGRPVSTDIKDSYPVAF